MLGVTPCVLSTPPVVGKPARIALRRAGRCHPDPIRLERSLGVVRQSLAIDRARWFPRP